MKKHFFLRLLSSLLLIAFVFLSPLFAAVAADGSETTVTDTDHRYDCRSALLMDADTGTILYEQNPDEVLPPASVTKIMTLLLVMEEIDKGNLHYDDKVTASANAASMGGSQIYLKEGESMSVEDLIKSVVIASANDAAVALAEQVAGSEEAFVQRMNERARELGMNNTNFENTNGLDDTAEHHVTTARDIALMSRELLRHKDILKYSSIWMDTIRDGAFGLTNTNRLVRFYPGATGLKTGSTSKAGFCVSATAERDGMHLICVVMAAPSRDVRNNIATQLLNFGFANYAVFRTEKAALTPMPVCGGVSDLCRLSRAPFSSIVKKGEEKKVRETWVLPDRLSAPIRAGEEIGCIEYRIGEECIGKSPIYAEETVEKISFFQIFLRMLGVSAVA